MRVRTAYAYSPLGDMTKAGTDSTTLEYTGRENDGATGLYYYRARYYSPALGRFISEDPIGMHGGLNLYGYAQENPMRFADPLGHGPWDKLYGLPREFWQWFHRLDRGKVMEELKDPATRQVPKDDAMEYYEEWLQKNPDERGSVDLDLIDWLFPWWLTPSSIGVAPCERDGTCSMQVQPKLPKICPH